MRGAAAGPGDMPCFTVLLPRLRLRLRDNRRLTSSTEDVDPFSGMPLYSGLPVELIKMDAKAA